MLDFYYITEITGYPASFQLWADLIALINIKNGIFQTILTDKKKF